MAQANVQPTPQGNLAAQVAGLGRRFRIGSLERHHSDRVVLASYSAINGAISIGLLAIIAMLTHEPFVFPSLGPTAFIVFYQSMSATAAPRNVFCGHLIGVLAGAAALLIFGLTKVAPDLEDVTAARVGACAVSIALTLGLMILLRVEHAPAAATTLIVALGLLRTPSQLATLMLAVVLLILQALAINRLAGVKYPLWNPATVVAASS